MARYLRGFRIFDIFGQLLSHFTIGHYPPGPNSPVHETFDTKLQRVRIGDVLELVGVRVVL